MIDDDAPTRLRLPRLSARVERVALPFWNGLFSAAASVLAGMMVTVAIAVLVMIALALIAGGRAPSTQAGSPLNTFILITFYVSAGSLAAWRMRVLRLQPFAPLRARDVRAIAIGFGALVLARFAAGIQIVLTHETKHVQHGFEHFSISGATPAQTDLALGLTAATLVLLAPVVEEMIFRGLFFGALARPLGIWAAALVSALVFGAVHGDWVLFPTLATLGFVNAVAYAATGNLTVPVVLHAINNAFATAFLIAQHAR